MTPVPRWPLILLALALAALRAAPAPGTTDAAIESAALASYNFRTVLDNRVKVDADNGIVTLSGTVLDRDQKSLAEATVRSLPGVVAVRNHLDVSEPGQERSDGWIALKIRSILLVRSDVSATNTTVSARDGVVMLTGTADSVLQKELTESYARNVQGVRAVRNELRVLPEAGEATANQAPPAERIDDNSITAQVRQLLLVEDAVAALDTRVETANGAVLLRGTARSPAEKERISELARGVRGVTSVANEMVVSVAE